MWRWVSNLFPRPAPPGMLHHSHTLDLQLNDLTFHFHGNVDARAVRGVRGRERCGIVSTRWSISPHAVVTSSVATWPHDRITFPTPGGGEEALMNPSEKFRRFAAACEAMSRFAKSTESKATWNRIAANWIL